MLVFNNAARAAAVSGVTNFCLAIGKFLTGKITKN